jgi:tetratricopeptide (TPR) repeat protein
MKDAIKKIIKICLLSSICICFSTNSNALGVRSLISEKSARIFSQEGLKGFKKQLDEKLFFNPVEIEELRCNAELWRKKKFIDEEVIGGNYSTRAKEQILKETKDLIFWQSVSFIRKLREEIEKNVPNKLKEIMIKYRKIEQEGYDTDGISYDFLNQISVDDIISERMLHKRKDGEYLSDERDFLEYVASVTFGYVYKKVTKPVERFKQDVLTLFSKMIEIKLNIIDKECFRQTITASYSGYYIDAGDEQNPCKELMPRAIYNDLVKFIDEMTIDELESLKIKIRELIKLREKLILYSNRVVRLDSFRHFYDRYNSSFEKYLDSIKESKEIVKKKEDFVKKILISIALNKMPFRKRFAKFIKETDVPGEYEYRDDDSMSAYSIYEILDICEKDGYVPDNVRMYDPFFGTGTTACLAQFFCFEKIVASELMLEGIEEEEGWYILLQKNMKIFNESIIEEFTSITEDFFKSMDILQFFSNVYYTQGFSEQIRRKSRFKVFSTRMLDKTKEEKIMIDQRDFKFILANPPWGIATIGKEDSCNEIRAFSSFFSKMLPKIYLLLEYSNSACFVRVPDYWACIIKDIMDIDSFEEFWNKFFERKKEELDFFEKVGISRHRKLESVEIEVLDPKYKEEFRYLFYQLKFIFNEEYPLFEIEKVAKNLLKLKKITPVDKVKLLPSLYLFFADEFLGYQNRQTRSFFDSLFEKFYNEYGEVLSSTYFLRHFMELFTKASREKGHFFDFSMAAPGIIENGSIFFKLYYQANTLLAKYKLEEIYIKDKDLVIYDSSSESYTLSFFAFVVSLLCFEKKELKITIQMKNVEKDILERIGKSWGIILSKEQLCFENVDEYDIKHEASRVFRKECKRFYAEKTIGKEDFGDFQNLFRKIKVPIIKLCSDGEINSAYTLSQQAKKLEARGTIETYMEARRLLKIIIEERKIRNVKYYIQLSEIYLKLGELDTAIEILKKAIKFDPYNHLLYWYLEKYYKLKGNINEVIINAERTIKYATVRKVKKEKEIFYSTYLDLGKIYIGLNNKLARKYLEKSISLNKEDKKNKIESLIAYSLLLYHINKDPNIRKETAKKERKENKEKIEKMLSNARKLLEELKKESTDEQLKYTKLEFYLNGIGRYIEAEEIKLEIKGLLYQNSHEEETAETRKKRLAMEGKYREAKDMLEKIEDNNEYEFILAKIYENLKKWELAERAYENGCKQTIISLSYIYAGRFYMKTNNEKIYSLFKTVLDLKSCDYLLVRCLRNLAESNSSFEDLEKIYKQIVYVCNNIFEFRINKKIISYFIRKYGKTIAHSDKKLQKLLEEEIFPNIDFIAREVKDLLYRIRVYDRKLIGPTMVYCLNEIDFEGLKETGDEEISIYYDKFIEQLYKLKQYKISDYYYLFYKKDFDKKKKIKKDKKEPFILIKQHEEKISFLKSRDISERFFIKFKSVINLIRREDSDFFFSPKVFYKFSFCDESPALLCVKKNKRKNLDEIEINEIELDVRLIEDSNCEAILKMILIFCYYNSRPVKKIVALLKDTLEKETFDEFAISNWEIIKQGRLCEYNFNLHLLTLKKMEIFWGKEIFTRIKLSLEGLYREGFLVEDFGEHRERVLKDKFLSKVIEIKYSQYNLRNSLHFDSRNFEILDILRSKGADVFSCQEEPNILKKHIEAIEAAKIITSA